MTACVVCGEPATSGLLLNATCLDYLARDIAMCARLHSDLEAVLVRPSSPDEGGGKRATSVGISLDDAAVTARDHIRATITGWVRVAQEERAGVEWPADDVAVMARWILRNLTWFAGRPWVDEMARMFGETADEARRAVQAERPRRMEIGPCPQRLTDDEGQDAGACTGTLFAVIWPNDPLLPCDVRCTSCDGRWSADQWHALGRRVEVVAKDQGETMSDGGVA